MDGTDYKLYRPLVDQLTLFNQCLIGAKSQFKSYEHVVSTGYVADLGMDLEKEIGNRYGMPLGRVITAKKIQVRTTGTFFIKQNRMVFPKLD